MQPKVLKSGLATVEQSLSVELFKFVKEIFQHMSGWVEEEVAETIGLRSIPKEKHAWEE